MPTDDPGGEDGPRADDDSGPFGPPADPPPPLSFGPPKGGRHPAIYTKGTFAFSETIDLASSAARTRYAKNLAEAAAATRGGFEAGARTDQVGEQPSVLVEHDGAVGERVDLGRP